MNARYTPGILVLVVAALVAALAAPSFAADALRPRAVAIKAVSALLVENDIEAFKAYVDPQAERKDKGPGSLLKSIDGHDPDKLAKLVLDRIIFLNEDSIEGVAADYPDDMWDRLKARMDDKSLVFATVMNVREREVTVLIAFIIRSVDGQPKIVYGDDD